MVLLGACAPFLLVIGVSLATSRLDHSVQVSAVRLAAHEIVQRLQRLRISYGPV